MGEGFNKFKRKIIVEVLIKTIAMGISLALIGVAISLFCTKINAIKMNPLFHFLIGIGVFILSSGISFWILFPSELKIAKRLDKDLALNEKVQTMVKFQSEEGLIINLQREDTKLRLANIGLEKLVLKISLFFIILLLLAASLCVSAIIIPGKEDEVKETEPTDDPFELDNWSIQAIRDLIETVEKSKLAQNVKDIYIEELNDLIAVLLETDLVGEMHESVLKTIDNIYFELDKINTDNEVFTVLSKSEESMILTLALYIDDLDLNNVMNALDSIQAMVNGENIPTNCANIDEYLGQTLEKSNVNKEDLLYLALTQLSDALKDCQTSSDLKNTFDIYKPLVYTALSIQKDNEDMAKYIDKKLKEIFNIIDDDEENPEGTDPGSNATDPNLEPSKPTLPSDVGQGGLGSGETQYGSNDAFYDPILGEIVYGDVIDDYYADIYNKMLDGSIPEELADYFEKYFDALYGSNKEKEE